MKKTLLFLSIASVILATSCCNNQSKNPTSAIENANSNLIATLYQSRSAEYVALCYQAYNAATVYLNTVLNETHEKPLCIVVDIDETVLDNIPSQEQLLIDGVCYDGSQWNKWVEQTQAKSIKGAREFLVYAQEQGIETFYITNRNEKSRAATLKNLQLEQFPFADDKHLLMKTEKSETKEPRREMVKQNFEIAILCGDNLGDFSSIFNTSDELKRMDATIENQELFGSKWIVLPNPTYGAWLDILKDGKRGNEAEINLHLKNKLKGYSAK